MNKDNKDNIDNKDNKDNKRIKVRGHEYQLEHWKQEDGYQFWRTYIKVGKDQQREVEIEFELECPFCWTQSGTRDFSWEQVEKALESFSLSFESLYGRAENGLKKGVQLFDADGDNGKKAEDYEFESMIWYTGDKNFDFLFTYFNEPYDQLRILFRNGRLAGIMRAI